MTQEFRQAKRPLSAALAGPYGHPYHPLLITVPIGAWVASLVFDIAARFVSDPGFLAQGSAWLIGIGIAGALLAGMAGALDLLTIPSGTKASRTAVTHMSLALLVTAAYAGNLLWRLAGHHRPVSVPAGPLALSVVSLAVLSVAGYLGGKLAFRYGVRVADESAQVDGYLRAERQQGARAWESPR
ncbi:MAG TPA: DUF2231 domain-containing protein [Streptosporangiaceae bacterium]|jgi:uncharacterized membrane protein